MAGSVIHALEDLVPFAEAPIIHIYEHPVDGGIVECMAVLVLKRDHGVLLAIPAGVVSQLELDEGQTATMIADLGPSALVEVGGARLSGTGAVSIPDSFMQVVLLDVGATAAVGRLSLLAQGMEPELLIPFDNGQPDLIPDPDALLGGGPPSCYKVGKPKGTAPCGSRPSRGIAGSSRPSTVKGSDCSCRAVDPLTGSRSRLGVKHCEYSGCSTKGSASRGFVIRQRSLLSGCPSEHGSTNESLVDARKRSGASPSVRCMSIPVLGKVRGLEWSARFGTHCSSGGDGFGCLPVKPYDPCPRSPCAPRRVPRTDRARRRQDRFGLSLNVSGGASFIDVSCSPPPGDAQDSGLRASRGAEMGDGCARILAGARDDSKSTHRADAGTRKGFAQWIRGRVGGAAGFSKEASAFKEKRQVHLPRFRWEWCYYV